MYRLLLVDRPLRAHVCVCARVSQSTVGLIKCNFVCAGVCSAYTAKKNSIYVTPQRCPCATYVRMRKAQRPHGEAQQPPGEASIALRRMAPYGSVWLPQASVCLRLRTPASLRKASAAVRLTTAEAAEAAAWTLLFMREVWVGLWQSCGAADTDNQQSPSCCCLGCLCCCCCHHCCCS